MKQTTLNLDLNLKKTRKREFLEQMETVVPSPDNGREFAGHESVSHELGAEFYFAHPYASWERGTNENTNGLIRQYFPKNRDFTTITDEEINMAVKQRVKFYTS